MNKLLILGISIMLIACGPDENIEKLCIANPQGEVDPEKVNITAIRGSMNLLKESNGEINVAEAPNPDALYSITDIKFELNSEIKIAHSDNSFSDWVQFESEGGAPSISFKIDGIIYTIDPKEWLIHRAETPFAAGYYIYYIVIEDLSEDKISLVIEEWEEYSSECNDVIQSFD